MLRRVTSLSHSLTDILLNVSTCISVKKKKLEYGFFSVSMVTRNSLDRSNCIHKITHIFSFFCYNLPASLVKVPRRVSIPQLRNENICYNFFEIVPHKGCQIKVLFLKCMETNGCEVFALDPVFIYIFILHLCY